MQLTSGNSVSFLARDVDRTIALTIDDAKPTTQLLVNGNTTHNNQYKPLGVEDLDDVAPPFCVVELSLSLD
jgi:hypothetical protein